MTIFNNKHNQTLRINVNYLKNYSILTKQNIKIIKHYQQNYILLLFITNFQFMNWVMFLYLGRWCHRRVCIPVRRHCCEYVEADASWLEETGSWEQRTARPLAAHSALITQQQWSDLEVTSKYRSHIFLSTSWKWSIYTTFAIEVQCRTCCHFFTFSVACFGQHSGQLPLYANLIANPIL